MAMELSFRTVSSGIQFLVLAYVFSKAIRNLQYYLLYFSDLSQYKPKAGNGTAWALVTGAADGIGKGYARDLCGRGFNVVIHDRDGNKLQGVKAELNKEFPGQEVKLLVLDATLPWTEKADEAVLAAVKGLYLTILINNLGGGGGIEPMWATVTQRSAADLDTYININARFMTQITRVLLPVLTRDKNQRTVIVNVSSGNAIMRSPYLVTYSATKAYVVRWSLSLDAELKAEGHKVDIHSFILGGVVTDNWQRETNLFYPDVPTFAKAALSKLGAGHVVCTPYWPHGIQVAFMKNLMPQWVGDKFMLDVARREMKRSEQIEREKAKAK